ncbi:hypothetical protein ACWDT6_30040 [Nocardia grenadensis]|uniref:hypothetical protein n=1 Tax=Embleya sp. NPDC005971 TaxID=3156724 RepID=UPI0033F8ECCF
MTTTYGDTMSIITTRHTHATTAGGCSVVLDPRRDFGSLTITGYCLGCDAGNTWSASSPDTASGISDKARMWATAHARGCQVPNPNTLGLGLGRGGGKDLGLGR